MDMNNLWIVIPSLLICLVGIGLAIYLLTTRHVDTKIRSTNLLLCFTGLAWMFFAMQTFDDITLDFLLGIFFYFLGFSIWTYHYLVLLKEAYQGVEHTEEK